MCDWLMRESGMAVVKEGEDGVGEFPIRRERAIFTTSNPLLTSNGTPPPISHTFAGGAEFQAKGLSTAYERWNRVQMTSPP